MKTRYLLIVTALALPLTAIAYPGGNEHGNRIDKLTQQLNLNAQQQQELEVLFQEQQQQFKAIHQQTRLKMETILTPEQLQQLDNMHNKGGKRIPGMH